MSEPEPELRKEGELTRKVRARYEERVQSNLHTNR